MLAVGLREHHQFNVGRVALQLGEGVDQVVDFVGGQRQAELGIGLFQRRFAALQHVNGLQRLAVQFSKQTHGGLRPLGHHAFEHAVVQQRGDLRALGFVQGRLAEKA